MLPYVIAYKGGITLGFLWREISFISHIKMVSWSTTEKNMTFRLLLCFNLCLRNGEIKYFLDKKNALKQNLLLLVQCWNTMVLGVISCLGTNILLLAGENTITSVNSPKVTFCRHSYRWWYQVSSQGISNISAFKAFSVSSS